MALVAWCYYNFLVLIFVGIVVMPVYFLILYIFGLVSTAEMFPSVLFLSSCCMVNKKRKYFIPRYLNVFSTQPVTTIFFSTVHVFLFVQQVNELLLYFCWQFYCYDVKFSIRDNLPVQYFHFNCHPNNSTHKNKTYTQKL